MSSSPHNLEQESNRLVGSRFGKYRIGGKLGEGGMGAVYEAEDESLKRHVALKIVAAREPHEVKRFVAEAQAAARLNHPNVVTVYEVSQFEGQQFLAMELVRGMSASEYLRTRGAMEWTVATRVAIAACRGLAAAHREGLIHRDLKPGNILLAKRGDIKIADFGLAKWLGGTERSMTAKGTVLGTPEYMSPEQCSSDVVTPQSDLYSLGASYFALLTGRPPFVCEQPVQAMFAHCSQPVPDPRELVPEIPAACVEIIRRAMAKQPHDRFASATEMQAALEAALKPGSNADEQTMDLRLGAKPNRPAGEATQVTLPLAAIRRGERRGVLIGVGLTLVAIAIGLVIARRPKPEPPSPQTTEPPIAQHAPLPGLLSKATPEGFVLRTLASDEGVFVGVAISPNGKHLAARVLGRDRGRVVVWDLDSDKAPMDRPGKKYGRASFLLRELVGTQIVGFTQASDWLVVGQLSGLDCDVEAWPMPPDESALPRTLSVDGKTVLSVAPSPGGDQCLMSVSVPTATETKSVYAYNWPNGARTLHWSDRLHRTSSHLLVAEPDGKHWLVSNGFDFVIRFDVSRPQLRAREMTTSNIDCLCSSPNPDSPWLAVGSADSVELLDLTGQHEPRRLRVGADPQGRITAIAPTTDGKSVIVAATASGVSKLVSVKTTNWTESKTIGTDLPFVCSLAVSPTTPVLVTASSDGTLRLWKLGD